MYEDIGVVARAYLKARKDFIRLSRKYPELLKGNDNIVGIIGDYIALKYLEVRGVLADKARTKSEPGFDLRSKTGNKISKRRDIHKFISFFLMSVIHKMRPGKAA
jgi:hypothetical protein